MNIKNRSKHKRLCTEFHFMFFVRTKAEEAQRGRMKLRYTIYYRPSNVRRK